MEASLRSPDGRFLSWLSQFTEAAPEERGAAAAETTEATLVLEEECKLTRLHCEHEMTEASKLAEQWKLEQSQLLGTRPCRGYPFTCEQCGLTSSGGTCQRCLLAYRCGVACARQYWKSSLSAVQPFLTTSSGALGAAAQVAPIAVASTGPGTGLSCHLTHGAISSILCGTSVRGPVLRVVRVEGLSGPWFSLETAEQWFSVSLSDGDDELDALLSRSGNELVANGTLAENCVVEVLAYGLSRHSAVLGSKVFVLFDCKQLAVMAAKADDQGMHGASAITTAAEASDVVLATKQGKPSSVAPGAMSASEIGIVSRLSCGPGTASDGSRPHIAASETRVKAPPAPVQVESQQGKTPQVKAPQVKAQRAKKGVAEAAPPVKKIKTRPAVPVVAPVADESASESSLSSEEEEVRVYVQCHSSIKVALSKPASCKKHKKAKMKQQSKQKNRRLTNKGVNGVEVLLVAQKVASAAMEPAAKEPAKAVGARNTPKRK
jgi:hypothetical protein